MRHFSLAPTSNSAVATPFHIVLANWLKAVAAFQESYYQLNYHMLSHESDGEQSSRLIGQYSTSQIADLLAKMCHELETLIADLDTRSNLSGLTNHTARLTLLTNQASVIISLLTRSSC